MSSLERDPLTKTIYGDLKRGIETTLEQRFHASALIILFSSMDIMAHLDRPETKVEGDASDFIRWCERYLMLDLPAGIPAEELYATRCAVLHMMGVESRLSRKGKVRRVGFMVGGGLPIAYDPKVDPAFVLINLDLLVKAFFAAIDRYVVEAFADAERRRIVEERLRKMLTSMPYNPAG
jgi:hypothetical protein